MNAMRTMALIAAVLQKMSNRSVFDDTTPKSIAFNEFIQKNSQTLSDFFEQMSRVRFDNCWPPPFLFKDSTPLDIFAQSWSPSLSESRYSGPNLNVRLVRKILVFS